MPTSKFSQSRPLPSANVAKATLDLLHDYDRLVRCQPLVGETQKLEHAPDGTPATESEKSPDHIWYQQIEHINILPFGIWRKKVIFNNWFKTLTPSSSSTVPSTETDAAAPVSSSTADKVESEGGVESICYAPSDIKIYAVFRVEKRRPNYKNGTIASREKIGNSIAPITLGNGAALNGVVDDVDNEGWRIVEETEMTCPNWLILQFSEKQHRAAHEKMLDTIVYEARKRAYASAPASTSTPPAEPLGEAGNETAMQ